MKISSIKFQFEFIRFLLPIIIGAFFVFSYFYFVLQPHQYDSFSLIDDGQSISNSEILIKCLTFNGCSESTSILVERQFGRFRPLYWLLQAVIQYILGLNPVLLHQFRVYIVGGLLALLVFLNIWSIEKSYFGSFFAVLVFITSNSFTENIVRLGPVEPYHLIVTSLFSLIYLNNEYVIKKIGLNATYISLIILLLFASLIKETTIILFGLIFFFSILEIPSNKLNHLKFATAILSVLLLAVVNWARSNPSATDYAGNYHLTAATVVKTFYSYIFLLNQTYGFVIVFFGALLVIQYVFLKITFKQFIGLLYWLQFSLGFIVVQLPWPYVIERYMLLPFFGISVLMGIILAIFIRKTLPFFLDKLIKPKILKRISTFIFFIVVINIFSLYLPTQLAKTLNYSKWYDMYLRFESEEVRYLVEHRDVTELNAIQNLNNWEVLYELPIHLQYIYNQNGSFKLYDSTKFSTDNLFVSSSLEKSSNEFVDSYILVENHVYTVDQISVRDFQNNFSYKPIQTVLMPPLEQTSITHSWQVWSRRE